MRLRGVHQSSEEQLTASSNMTMSPVPANPAVTAISKCTVFPETRSTLGTLKLSVSDLPMLSCHYIQKGVLLPLPPNFVSEALVNSLKQSLSQALVHFPPLAGRLTTDHAGGVYITCNDAGVDFLHANAGNLKIRDVLTPSDVPDCVKKFFTFDYTISYEGHRRPLAAVQVTELADGVFIGCSVNHAIADGTSFWNFFNTWAEVCRGVARITRPPDFRRNFVKDSRAVLLVPAGGPAVTFDAAAPIRERIFHFTRESIQELKDRANERVCEQQEDSFSIAELAGKKSNDCLRIRKGETRPFNNATVTSVVERLVLNGVVSRSINSGIAVSERVAMADEISRFQSLCAQLWRSVTRARNLDPAKETTFRMAVNCRHRIEPPIHQHYFGNAIQSIRTVALAGELLSRDLQWSARRLHENVAGHEDLIVRRRVDEWEQRPHMFPLGNPDGASITMGSSPRFPMYDNDFGWGRPLAVQSGRANKFDGKISAFPGREGCGSVDLEVCLAPEAMAALETDAEFMRYVTPRS